MRILLKQREPHLPADYQYIYIKYYRMAELGITTNTQLVSAYIQKLGEPTAAIVEALRQIILSTDPEIAEEIKWNAPSFFYTGPMKPFNPKEYKRHIIVMNLHKRILLVLPSGVKLNDASGLLEGGYSDGRRLVNITGMADVIQKEPLLRATVKEWLKVTKKEYSQD